MRTETELESDINHEKTNDDEDGGKEDDYEIDKKDFEESPKQ